VVTSYTRWLECVQTRGAENQEVYLTFSPSFERIWLESKERLPEYVSHTPANLGLRSQYSIRLYGWAKKYVETGTKLISLEQLRKVLGLESVQDAEGNIIQEAPLPVWANFRQRALDTAITEITKKTDISIAHRVTCAIKTSAGNVGDFFDQDPSCTEWRRIKSITNSVERQGVATTLVTLG
jgi:plasmid replication initiation protein